MKKKTPPKGTARPAGRPRKIPTPAIDHDAIAERLRQLRRGDGTPADPLGTEDTTPAPAAPPADIPTTPAADLPPLPPSPENPIDPDSVTPGESAREADEQREMFAHMLATGLVAGYIGTLRSAGLSMTPPRRTKDAHPIPLEWTQDGLTNKIRSIIGSSVMGDGAKIFFGALGIGVSMFWGAEVVSSTGAAADTPTPQAGNGAGGQAAAPTTPPTRPAPARGHQNGTAQYRLGEAPPAEQSAVGRF